jgi:hypothetical protein
MNILQLILMLLSTLSSPLGLKILACVTDPKNTTWALKLACITSATQGQTTPGTAEHHTVEAIKAHAQAAVDAGT